MWASKEGLPSHSVWGYPGRTKSSDSLKDAYLHPYGTSMPLVPTISSSVFASYSNEALLQEAQQGAPRFLDELLRRHYSRMHRTILRIVKHAENAQDITQESLIHAFLNFESFRGESTFGTWTTRIAINAALMHLRKERRIASRMMEEEMTGNSSFVETIVCQRPSAETIYMRKQQTQRMYRLMDELAPHLRTITLDRLQTDDSVEQIAKRQKISLAAAKSRLLRARVLLVDASTSQQRSRSTRSSTRSNLS